jgi:hypothetical protein
MLDKNSTEIWTETWIFTVTGIVRIELKLKSLPRWIQFLLLVVETFRLEIKKARTGKWTYIAEDNCDTGGCWEISGDVSGTDNVCIGKLPDGFVSVEARSNTKISTTLKESCNACRQYGSSPETVGEQPYKYAIQWRRWKLINTLNTSN